jgi:hemin uptake protein HemP
MKGKAMVEQRRPPRGEMVTESLEDVMNQTVKTNQAAHVHPQPSANMAPRVRSGDLLRGHKRLVIEHGEASYTLLLTRNGKLILTK